MTAGPRKKQRARLLKAVCGRCGYTVRVTRKWIDVGPPPCPAHGAMTIERDQRGTKEDQS